MHVSYIADGERLEDLSREDMPDVEEPLDQSTIGQRQKGAVVYSFEDAISTKDGPQEESERAWSGFEMYFQEKR